MSPEENKRIVRRIPMEAFNQGRLTVLDEVISEDFVNRNAMPGMADRGVEAINQLVTAIRTAFPNIKYTLDAEIAEGDKVVHMATARGTNSGEFMGIPPTEKSATWTEMHIVRIVNGKCVEHWGQVDMLGIMQQLGLAPAA